MTTTIKALVSELRVQANNPHSIIVHGADSEASAEGTYMLADDTTLSIVGVGGVFGWDLLLSWFMGSGNQANTSIWANLEIDSGDSGAKVVRAVFTRK